MKLRKGFVSNSSSSSFIVQFDQNPFDREYLRKVLFNNEDVIRYEFDDKEIFAVDQLIDWVIKELKKGEITEMGPIIDAIKSGYVPEVDSGFKYPSSSNLTPEEWNKQWAEVEKGRKEAAEKYAANWMKGKELKHIYIMEFSDQDGSIGSQLEHGGTFQNVSHKQISHH